MCHARNETSDRSHFFEVNRLPAKLNFIRNLLGKYDLHALVVQRNGLQFVRSVAGHFQFVMRN